MLATLSWACTLLLTMCMLALEHAHFFSWACAHFHFCMYTSSLDVDHMNAFTWASAWHHLSICIPSLKHVYAFSWTFAHFHLSMCTFLFWACACFAALFFCFRMSLLFSLFVLSVVAYCYCLALQYRHARTHQYRLLSRAHWRLCIIGMNVIILKVTSETHVAPCA